MQAESPVWKNLFRLDTVLALVTGVVAVIGAIAQHWWLVVPCSIAMAGAIAWGIIGYLHRNGGFGGARKDYLDLRRMSDEDESDPSARILVEAISVWPHLDRADQFVELRVRISNGTVFELNPQPFDAGAEFVGGPCERHTVFMVGDNSLAPVARGTVDSYTLRQFVTPAHAAAINAARAEERTQLFRFPPLHFRATRGTREFHVTAEVPSLSLVLRTQGSRPTPVPSSRP